ncbi:hypothetical protein CWATWH0402_6221 [Crocosphaera watsonii WH 0402]|nr:hypothetical protein CWATWH0402_6221 [Crocosphaera watsonii WH 0402]
MGVRLLNFLYLRYVSIVDFTPGCLFFVTLKLGTLTELRKCYL